MQGRTCDQLVCASGQRSQCQHDVAHLPHMTTCCNHSTMFHVATRYSRRYACRLTPTTTFTTGIELSQPRACGHICTANGLPPPSHPLGANGQHLRGGERARRVAVAADGNAQRRPEHDVDAERLDLRPPPMRPRRLGTQTTKVTPCRAGYRAVRDTVPLWDTVPCGILCKGAVPPGAGLRWRVPRREHAWMGSSSEKANSYNFAPRRMPSESPTCTCAVRALLLARSCARAAAHRAPMHAGAGSRAIQPAVGCAEPHG